MMAFFDTLYAAETDRFSRPATIRTAPHPYNHDMIHECVVALADEPGEKINRDCRIYSSGRQLAPFEAKTVLRTLAKRRSLDSAGWSSVFGDQEFLIFVNRAAQFSSSLRRASLKFLQGFGARFSSPGIEVEHHIILGRYSETAFGVHVDDPQDRVVHFNLGPHPKEMILWPRSDYISRYQGPGARPLSQVSHEGAVRYPMEPGSCFFLPADYYHVGRSADGLSCVVALAFSRVTAHMAIKEAISEAERHLHSSDNESAYWTDFEAATADPVIHELSQVLKHQALQQFHTEAEKRRRSNASFSERVGLSRPDIPSGSFCIQLIDPSMLIIESTIEQMKVFFGGHTIKIEGGRGKEILDKLSSGGKLAVSGPDLLSEFRLRREEALLITWLMSTGLVSIEPPAKSP